MSVLPAACCCGEPAECFFGVSTTDGATACGHNLTEQLIYKRERPAFTDGFNRYDYSDCECEGTYVTARSCPSSPAVECRYEHFQNNDPTKVWTWYYRNFADIFPPCDSHCCGYTDDVDCCDGSDLSDCSLTHRTPTGGPASKFQANVIDHGSAPALSSDASAEDCQYGDEYTFLQGISDRSAAEYYRHWSVSGSTVTEVSRRHLCATVIAVFHREHWYKRSYNSLSTTDNPEATTIDNAAAPCGTPKWWVMACSGCFVTSSDVMIASSLDDVGGVDVREDFLVKVNNGDPVPEAWLDVLVADGIINIGDHGRPGGEIIKKTLTYYRHAEVGRPIDVVAYFYGRSAGWTYVCEDFTAGSEQDVLDNYFPQIVRRSSVTCDTGGDGNCHTAAPIPANGCTSCTTTPYGDEPPGACDPCAIPPAMGDCGLPVHTSCGATGDTCYGDVVVGTCRGVWVQYWEYLLAKPTATYALNYVCNGEPNNGYLCRIAKEGDKCVWNELPDEIHHQIPPTASGSVRLGTSDDANLCCGGEGSHQYSGEPCPSSTPNAPDDCDEPPDWGPDL